MPQPTPLESRIRSALAQLREGVGSRPFDIEQYGKAFHGSARSKAKHVIEVFRKPGNPLRDLRPVLVSVGGADGEELQCLLEGTSATVGILLERSRDLAIRARERQHHLPDGKRIDVFEGDAGAQISTVIRRAADIVRSGEAECLLVSCHAVIHELFDRSPNGFDPPGFFGSIFEHHEIPTWFTYREPGVPEKWPEVVLIEADCPPAALRDLAEEIRRRHPALEALRPIPQAIGDHLRAHRDLAMEVICKLFYIGDLSYELEERSTSVNHQELVAFLLLAIGDNAKRERRGDVTSSSAPTDSFESLWKELKLRAWGLGKGGAQHELSIPESQTRVIAWRTEPQQPEVPLKASGVSYEVRMARNSLGVGDNDLCNALIFSQGRSWIESDERDEALQILKTLNESSPKDSEVHLWTHYLLALAKMFSSPSPEPNLFSADREQLAKPFGLDALFRAERMELLRKAGDRTSAVAIANQLLNDNLPAGSPTDHRPLRRYAAGTSLFVLANHLRYGGMYGLALEKIAAAETWLVPGIASHDTERLHCFYARSVCSALQGNLSVTPPFRRISDVDQRFAGALIQLTYANAAWVINDLVSAERYALEAADTFLQLGAGQYVKRARTIAYLFCMWRGLEVSHSSIPDGSDASLRKGVFFIAGRGPTADLVWFRNWFAQLRPSMAAGLLQFRRFSSAPASSAAQPINSPPLLVRSSGGDLEWKTESTNDLDDLERILRQQLGSPPGTRIPLLSD